MARGATLSVRKFFFVGEAFEPSIVAAGKPLPQEKYQLTWKVFWLALSVLVRVGLWLTLSFLNHHSRHRHTQTHSDKSCRSYSVVWD